MNDADEPESNIWPLHPQPYKYEILSMWVERIAAAYQISYRSFCLYGLKLSYPEMFGLSSAPPERALDRLAVGTGVPIEQLRDMTIGSLMTKIQRDLEVDLQKGGHMFAEWVEELSVKSGHGFKTDPHYWHVIATWEKNIQANKARSFDDVGII